MTVTPIKRPSKLGAIELGAIEPKAAIPTKPKILIYGKSGVGKTWASLDFPKVYYIDTEGGATREHYTDKLKNAGGVYFGIGQGSLDFETVLDQIKALATEQHEYKTVIIDSITKLFNQEVAKESERLGDKNAFGADKKPAVAMMRKLVSWLQRINMNVILIAHEKTEWGNRNGERVEIGNTFDCWDKLEYELDLCLNIIKTGASRFAKVRKSRLLEFPDASTFEWSYKNFAEKYGEQVIEESSKAIKVATDEQLEEFRRLLGLVKLDEKVSADKKILELQDSIHEEDSEKVAKIITYLKNKIGA